MEYREGPEGVRWELGFAHILTRKMGLHSLGLGFINKKQEKMGMGLRFEQDRHSDNEICAVGRWDLVKICAVKWEKGPRPCILPLWPRGTSIQDDIV